MTRIFGDALFLVQNEDLMTEWSEQETSTHQDHVIAHVIGATVLGYVVLEEAAHLLLDIGFVWTILLDGEMGLVPQSMAFAELPVDDEAKARLLDDARRLQESGPVVAQPLSMMRGVPAECLITGIGFFAHEERRKIVVEGEGPRLLIETSLVTREVSIKEAADSGA